MRNGEKKLKNVGKGEPLTKLSAPDVDHSCTIREQSWSIPKKNVEGEKKEGHDHITRESEADKETSRWIDR